VVTVSRSGRRRTGAAVATLVVLLAGAGTTLAGAEPPVRPDDVADHAPAGTGVDRVEVSVRDHVVKEVGEPAGLAADGEAVFELTVEAVTVMTQCPGRGIDPTPERGYFLVLDVTAELDAAAPDHARPGTDAFLPLVSAAFQVVRPDGTAQEDAGSAAAWACFDESELAPAFVEPGERVTGKVVLDAEAPSGTVVYDPERTGGWEWAYGG
jgi:hypothetical protein